MALSLPYPNMDFVPLDILTAQEQDQLVANIEYIASQFPVASANIADGSISTAKIASGAVTNAKIGSSAVKSNNIDWTTLPFNYSTSEVDTGWTYQDGKHIFKRTVVSNITTTRNTIVVYNTNISGVANIIRTDGWWANYQNQKMQIGAYFGGQYSCPYLPDGSSIIHIGFVADSDGSKPFQATFYYTKN